MSSMGFYLAATAAVAALRCIRSGFVVVAFGFLRVTQRSSRAIERLGFLYRDRRERMDELEGAGIRRLAIDVISLVADGIAPAAFHPVIVVIQDFLEGTFVDHCLVALDAWSLLSLEGFNGHRAKLDSFHRLPRWFIAFQNLDTVESRRRKCGEKSFLGQRTGNAAAPQLRIVLQMLGHFLIANDVGNNGAPADLENAKDLVEELAFSACFDKVQDAIGNDDVDGVVPD